MKKYIKQLLNIGLILLIISVWSCDSNINLNAEGIISADGYFSTPEDYEKSLNSLYRILNYGNNDLWLDGSTDNGLVTHSWNRGYDLGRGIANTASSFPANKWENGYIYIQRANNIINNIDLLEWPNGENNEQRNQFLSEARTLRAYIYLDLASLFGNIMFYEKNPATVKDAEEIPQVESKVVFDFVIKELEESISHLPDTPSSKSRFGKQAARILRARAAAYAAGLLNDKSYFNIVLTETDEALKQSNVSLGEYDALFKSNNENINEILLVRTYSPDALNYWGDWYNNSIGGYCVTTPRKALVDAYEYIDDISPNLPYLNKDPRFYSTIYAPGSIIRGKYYNTIPHNTIEKDGKLYFDPNKDYGAFQDLEVMHGDVLGEAGGGEWNKTPSGLSFKKYLQEDETWNTYNSFIIFRIAEAYLLRAEAIIETGGNEEEAKSLLRVIRERAGNTNDIDFVISNIHNGSILDLIRNERRVEFAQEGLRHHDIRRWNIFLDVMNTPIEGVQYRDFTSGTPKEIINVPAQRDEFTEKYFLWPIPQSEMDLDSSKRIRQNPNW